MTLGHVSGLLSTRVRTGESALKCPIATAVIDLDLSLIER